LSIDRRDGSGEARAVQPGDPRLPYRACANTSLCFDELSLARNISGRSLIELVRQPLAYQQVAPVGFVALTKAATLAPGAASPYVRHRP
jgi:hypothetical protein